MEPVINLGQQPLPDDLIEIGKTDVCERYPIEILFCSMCRTAHQRYQVFKEKLFAPDYHYRAKQTNDVLDGMRQFVDSIEKYTPVKGLKVLDIGCNDGSLLDVFRDRGAYTRGVEPTAAALECEHDVHMGFFNALLADKIVGAWGRPDIITFTNVFAHIEDLDRLIFAINRIKHANTMIVIENHYLGSVLDRHQFDTFYHEHLRTYSYSSFVHIAYSLGMHVKHVEFPARYGGNIRVFLVPGQQPGNPLYLDPERDFGIRLQELGQDVDLWAANKVAKILVEVSHAGALVAVAFPARASLLLNVLGLGPEQIRAIYEKEGSKKIGYYAPGTRIPILSDKNVWSGCSYNYAVLNLAWHIPMEIERRWRSHGFKGRFIQAVSEEDFHI